MAGDDEIRGGAGKDVIIGGQGQDDLYGGEDSDTFVFKSFLDSTLAAVTSSQINGPQSVTGLGLDSIRDFEVGIDKIDLSGIDANILSAGKQAFTFRNSPDGISPATFSGTAGELILVNVSVAPSPDTPGGFFTAVLGDIDGDAQWDFAINVITPTSLVPLTEMTSCCDQRTFRLQELVHRV